MSVKFVFNPFTGTFDAVDTANISGTFEAICKSTDAVGDCVKVIDVKVGELYQVEKLDIDTDTKPAVGIIESKSTSTRCVVRVMGILSGVYAGLLPGEQYFVDASSQLDLGSNIADPLSGTRYLQVMGVAVSDDEFLVTPANTRLKKVPS